MTQAEIIERINAFLVDEFEVDAEKIAPDAIEKVKSVIKVKSDFAAFQIINNLSDINYLNY